MTCQETNLGRFEEQGEEQDADLKDQKAHVTVNSETSPSRSLSDEG
jgi:hypothetical protein